MIKRFLYELVRIVVPLLILAAGVGGFLVFGQKPEVPTEIPPPPVPLVETVPVSTSKGVFDIEVDGVAIPYRQISVPAEVSGRIKSKSNGARAGSYVRAGDVLFEIENDDYRIEVNRLTAMLDQANAELQAADVEISNTNALIALAEEEMALRKRELDRALSLSASGASTESLLDQAKNTALAARRSLMTLENQLRLLTERKKTLHAGRDLAAAQLQQAELDLARTKVTAPLTGTVVEDHVEEDDFVNRGDPLVRISDSSRIEVAFDLTVPEIYWVWLNAGLLLPGESVTQQRRFEIPPSPVEIVYEFQNVEYVWKGHLGRYEGSGLDPQTRTVPCRAVVEAPTEVTAKPRSGGETAISLPALYAGMYVTVRIPIESPLPLAEIPQAALQPGNQSWVVREGKLRILPATVARMESDSVFLQIVPEGPQPGDAVVVSPLAVVHDGMPVEEAVER